MSGILLNDTTINVQGGPMLVRAGETVNDPGMLAALPLMGGVLWPTNDVTVAAAAALVLKLRAKGADERICSAAMVVAAASMLSQSDVAASFAKLAADGAAATATSETAMGMISPAAGGNVVAAYFVPQAALTADPTNNATLTIQKRTAGGAAVTIAQVTTTTAAGGTGNWTAWQPVPITVSASAVANALDAITFNISKSGTGVVVPAGQILIFVS
jgi:hypothetical protein